MAVGTVEREIFRDEESGIGVARFETACGPRLRIRDVSGGREIFLDPIELEGLTRAVGAAFSALGDGLEIPSPDESATHEIEPGEIFQNEFAMVQVGPSEGGRGLRLLIRDLASRAEILLSPGQLQLLTSLRHREFAALLDPSELVAAVEPDPDQV
ncbi:MAG: hypothetical protein ACRDJ5_09065 [Actinomycetota bacterium]